jgi:hypothetical protein
MERRRVIAEKSFVDALGRLTPEEQDATREAVRHFRDRSNENALRPERKSGLKGIWAFRVSSGIRVFYEVVKDDAGQTMNRLLHVGRHDDYRTVKRKKRR